MASFDLIWLGQNSEGSYVADTSVTDPNIRRIEETPTRINGTNVGNGSYSFPSIPNGKYLFYDGDTLKENVFGTSEQGGKPYFDLVVDGTFVTIADGIITVNKIADLAVSTAKLAANAVTPAKMAAQIKTLTSLSDVPDYIGQPGRFGTVNYIALALSGTMWEKIPNEIPVNEIVLNNEQTHQVKKYINSVFAGYNNEANLFYGYSSCTASTIPNDETCLFTKSVIRNIHRFAIPASSSSGGVQQAAADITNGGLAGCFGAWFRKSSLQSFVAGNQGINFAVYQIGSPTKTNIVQVFGANLYTVGYINSNTTNGYTVTVKVVAERGGWIYITMSFDTVLSGYTQTRLLMTFANSLNGSGFNMDIMNPTYLFGTDYVDPTMVYAESASQALLMDTTISKLNYIQLANRNIPAKALRICYGGTSITDEGHLLASEDGFTGRIADYVFNVLADSVKYNEAIYSGPKSLLYSMKFYKGAAYKITEVGSYVEFDLYGDELMLVHAMERTATGSSLIQLSVDGVNHGDAFSNYNPRPKGTGATINWTGDGTKTKFSLGKNFCYNPRNLTVNSVAKTVKLNTYSPPVNYSTFDGYDAIIIRKYESVSGEIVVNNYLMFLTPPANGHIIALTYDYGENVTWTKSTVGSIAATIGEVSLGSAGNLEAYVGDAATETAAATITQESLDYRQSNPDAIKVWKFTDKKRRTFRFTITGFDAYGSGTPYFIFNFAANRAHMLMNAGIHGNTAHNLAAASSSSDLRTTLEIQKFRPDIFIFESSTNDDRAGYNYYVSTKQISGVTEAAIREYPLKWLKSSVYDNPTYTIETALLDIAAVTITTIQLDDTDVTFGTPAAGDIIIIGNYHIDNRQLAARVISAWDSGSKTVTFKEPLDASEIFGITALSDLVGMNARIFRAGDFETSVNTIFDAVSDANPHAALALITDGLPNGFIKSLDGYPRKMRKMALAKGAWFGNVHEIMKRFQYTQPMDTQCYLNDGSNTVADGSSSYTLKTAANANPCASKQYMFWSVKVNGVEVYGKDCYIEGGTKGTFASSLTAAQCIASTFSDAESKISSDVLPVKLVFFQNTPTTGASIIVKFASIKGSDDDTHPNVAYGRNLYAAAILDVLKQASAKVSAV